MILKSYEINKINKNINRLILFYGKNEGLKNEALDIFIKDKNSISNYEEKEILDNENNFMENILSKSLFDSQKFIFIKRATDKILKIIEILHLKNLEDTTIILNSDNLEKKSKLRSFFEKDKTLVCIPFYPDNDQTLSKLAYNFLREKKISISSSNINLIINKCSGDRKTLINELQKIELFCKKGKQINSDNISKLINLNENHSISELVDNCLAKNKKKIINILNENNFSNEDCIVITRFFILKAKKLLNLSKTFEINKNIDLTISSAKPPIFWKEKEITKLQVQKWSSTKIKKLIFTMTEIELQIKKNTNNSINLITDFILNQFSAETNI
jgi:DNA polymerase-3 subunit delta